METQNTSHDSQVEGLQRQIKELKKSWPAHSVPAAMLLRLEELEEELEKELKKSKADTDA